MTENGSEPDESVSASSNHRIIDSLALIAVLLGVTGLMMFTGLWQTRLMELQGVDAAGEITALGRGARRRRHRAHRRVAATIARAGAVRRRSGPQPVHARPFGGKS